MKPAPAPKVPGNTEAERMSNALRMVHRLESGVAKEGSTGEAGAGQSAGSEKATLKGIDSRCAPRSRGAGVGKSGMSEEIKLDPLVNRRVIFKLHGQEDPMDATILGFDDTGYWIKGGSLAKYLNVPRPQEIESDVRFLEFDRIARIQDAPSNSK
jgi:hypothetical protein